jgi:hypothetical protein
MSDIQEIKNIETIIKKEKPCGNPGCMVSAFDVYFLTFGSGKLDFYGFWEKPCSLCARDFEKKNPQYFPCWPLPENLPKDYWKTMKPRE